MHFSAVAMGEKQPLSPISRIAKIVIVLATAHRQPAGRPKRSNVVLAARRPECAMYRG